MCHMPTDGVPSTPIMAVGDDHLTSRSWVPGLERRPRLSGTRVVRIGFGIAVVEALALALAAWLTGSAAMLAQTAACIADVAVEVFLLIGVARSSLPSNPSHPLGYGAERFYWSLFAAIGIFLAGGGIAIEESVRALGQSSPVGSYALGYGVLLVTIVLDSLALGVAARPILDRARARGTSLRAQIRRTTDPASTTILVGNAAGVLGGVLATVGLAGRQLTGSALPDAAASAGIGLLLVAASATLLRTNRELLTGRGVPDALLNAMRATVERERGVASVPDLFAVLVGPSSLLVAADITLDDAFSVPQAEAAIEHASAALRELWPTITYVYLTPVAEHRPRAVYPIHLPAGGNVSS
jgi:cation diffusion facilitator family transporter